MTIQSELKLKEKEANRRHELDWQRRQTIKTVKGCLMFVGLVSIIIFISLLYQ